MSTNADLFHKASQQLKAEGRGTMQTNPNLVADRNALISQMRAGSTTQSQPSSIMPTSAPTPTQPKNTQATVGKPNQVPTFDQYLGAPGAGADMGIQNLARQEYEKQFRGMTPGTSMDTTTATGAPTNLTNSMTSSTDIGRATGEDFSNVFNTAGFQEGQRRFDNIVDQRDAGLDRMMDFQTQNQNLQADTFKRLFGEGSRLDQFFSPSIRAVEQNILDTSQSLGRLDQDIRDRFQASTMTDAQRRKLEQQERDNLSRTLSDLTFAKERLNVDRDFEVGMAEREMAAITKDYENFLQALDTDMRERGMPEQAIQFLEQAVAQDYQMQMTRLQEQQQIAEERRMEAQMLAQPDLELSQSTGFMTNAYGQYMLDKDGNMIPFVSGGEALQLLERGGVTYLFDPNTGEYQVIAGAPGSGGVPGGDVTGSIPGVSPDIAGMSLSQLVKTLEQIPGQVGDLKPGDLGKAEEILRGGNAVDQENMRQYLAMHLQDYYTMSETGGQIDSLVQQINQQMPGATRAQKASALVQRAQAAGLPVDQGTANQYFASDARAVAIGAIRTIQPTAETMLEKIPGGGLLQKAVTQGVSNISNTLETLRQKGAQ